MGISFLSAMNIISLTDENLGLSFMTHFPQKRYWAWYAGKGCVQSRCDEEMDGHPALNGKLS